MLPNRHRRLARILASSIVLIGLVSNPVAGATAVTHAEVDQTYLDEVTTEFCGFDVILHEVSNYTITTRTSKTGSRYRELVGGVSTYTWFAPSTGKTVEAQNTGGINVSVTTTATEFAFVFLFHGLNYRVVTDEGTFVSAGSIADGVNLRFNVDGSVSSLRVFGHAHTPSLFHLYPRLCVWLGAIDTDGDYLPDTQGLRNEQEFGTDPLNPDTDGDGYTDGDEVGNETDPTNPASHPKDAIGDIDKDDDFLSDGTELLVFRTDPRDPDTDNDGFLDGYEVYIYFTDPRKARSHP